LGLTQYIWFEKYRPKNLKDMSLNKEHRASFKKFIKDGEIPHLLLEGPQGSGKTTMAYILMDKIPCIRLTLNASGKDRGIDTIRGRVKQFAGSKAPKGKIKIILFDEADALTPDAQTALRNTMETYSKNCRFILTCNYVDKIIGPLQSRCSRFTFDRFPKRKLVSVCEDILGNESIEDVSRVDITELINRFYPDMRSIVNNLQSACITGKFNPKAIGSLNADPKEVVDLLIDGKLLEIRNAVVGITDFMYMYRYMMDEWILDFKPEQQMLIVQIIGDSVRYTNRVPDKEIEFMNCCALLLESLEIEVK
jgi:replication factor C small subunit